MKKRLTATTLFAAFMGLTSLANAQCAVDYTRTACAGQEAISYKKCGGNQSCQKIKKADSNRSCWQAAIKSCNNGRLDITKYKQISASYNGQPLVGGFDSQGNPSSSGANFCWKGRPDLNQCK
jgi:hypothetical protein